MTEFCVLFNSNSLNYKDQFNPEGLEGLTHLLDSEFGHMELCQEYTYVFI